MRRRKNATVSRSSPKGGKRGCLCSDGKTYSSKCCDGTLEAQGVGSVTIGATDSAGTITIIDTTVTITSTSS
jgi:hypothetical protein|tara:strand:+ start:3851 stop:4066 length:216 start_codon:yes stop_codon:yes gene_type:complete